MTETVRETLDRRLSALDWTPENTCQVLRQMRGEKPVRYAKRKLSAALAVTLILVCLAAAALAVSAAFGLFTAQVAGMEASGQMAVWGGLKSWCLSLP